MIVATTPWNPARVLVATAALFVAYTALGGQRAVVGTDLVQFSPMVAGLLGVALPLALGQSARTPPPARLLAFPTGPAFGWADVAALLVLVGLPHAVGSDVWAKVLSARDESAARRAALGAAGVKVAFGLATVAIALAGIARGVGGPPAQRFPRAVFALAGPALSPFLLVALLATMQSSADSVLLSAAAATSHDLLPRSGVGAARAAVVPTARPGSPSRSSSTTSSRRSVSGTRSSRPGSSSRHSSRSFPASASTAGSRAPRCSSAERRRSSSGSRTSSASTPSSPGQA